MFLSQVSLYSPLNCGGLEAAWIAGPFLLPVLWRVFRAVNELQQMRNLTFNTTVVQGERVGGFNTGGELKWGVRARQGRGNRGGEKVRRTRYKREKG